MQEMAQYRLKSCIKLSQDPSYCESYFLEKDFP